MLQSSSKANTEMDPLDSANRRVSVILASFTTGAMGSGKEPDEVRVRSEYGDGLLSTSAVSWDIKAGRKCTEGGEQKAGDLGKH